ncbi:MAG: SsrA-binding protein SmpB [Candidatus Yanofskybacteria bacterium]|nr:SsrA-binding protein SmpB [Candidatus Yanofskybacteria bacterium]
MSFATNPKAYFDYNVLETFEAGLVLSGQEVKSVKNGKVSIRGAFVKILNAEAWLIGATISPYQQNNTSPDYDPQRTRKLLLKKKEVNYLFEKSQEAGLSIVPLKLYEKKNLIKLEIGLARGKKKYDKRESIKKKEEERKIRRELS